MSRKFNMPVEKDVASMEAGGGKRKASPLFRMLPTEDGKQFHNKCYFSLFRPAAWKIFKDLAINGEICVPEDLWTFYFRLFGHYIEDVPVKGSDGKEYKQTVFAVCKRHMNKYLTEVLEFKPLFEDDRCPLCEESDIWWGKWKDKWTELGYPDNKRYELDKADYKQIVETKHPVLKSIRDEAFKWSKGDRYIFVPWDYSKVVGEKPMDEGEVDVDYQVYMGPKVVFDDLHKVVSMGVDFWDLDNPRIMVVTRDTTDGIRRSNYSTQTYPNPPELNEDELAYLADENSLPDPSQYIKVLDYDEMRKLSGLEGSPVSEESPKGNGSGDNGKGNGKKETAKTETVKTETAKETPKPASRRRRGAASGQAEGVKTEKKETPKTETAPPPAEASTSRRRRRGSEVW